MGTGRKWHIDIEAQTPIMSDMEKFLSTSQVGKILGLTRARIGLMIVSGKIKAMKVGRHWVIPEPEIKGWKKVKHGTVYWLEKDGKKKK